MENPSLVLAISKLAMAGEQAGFTLEQMIKLLDDGPERDDFVGTDRLASPRCATATRFLASLSLGDVGAEPIAPNQGTKKTECQWHSVGEFNCSDRPSPKPGRSQTSLA